MKKPKTLRRYVEIGAVIGVGFGVGFGTVLENVGFGIGIGGIIGAAIGALLYEGKEEGQVIIVRSCRIILYRLRITHQTQFNSKFFGSTFF